MTFFKRGRKLCTNELNTAAPCLLPPRAFAFAHVVGLRLEPWYGRPRTSSGGGPSVADSAAAASGGTAGVTVPAGEDTATPTTTAAAARRGGYGSGSDGVRSSEAADLLACGCVLAEMCAGEPILAGPSSSSEKATSRGGGGDGWLEAAVELPLALRNTIGALTHADPAKVGGLLFVLRKRSIPQRECRMCVGYTFQSSNKPFLQEGDLRRILPPTTVVRRFSFLGTS